MKPIVFSLAAGALALLSACSGDQGATARMDENGAVSFDPAAQIGKESELRNFTRVEAVGPDTVKIRTGGDFSVRAVGDPAVLAKLEIRLVNGALEIGRKGGSAEGGADSTDKGATIHVTMPKLAAASLTGSGDMEIDKATGEAVSLSLAGSGDLDIGGLAVESLKVSATGSGDVDLAGAAKSAELSIAGSGDVGGKSLRISDADVSILGSGSATFASDGQVDANILGSGDVNVKGPAHCRKTGMGSGEARCAT